MHQGLDNNQIISDFLLFVSPAESTLWSCFTMELTWISIMTNGIELLFMCILTIYVSSLISVYSNILHIFEFFVLLLSRKSF